MKSFRLSTVFAAALLGIATTASAGMEMKVFDGYTSSRAVLAGHYESAINIATQREDTSIRFHRIVNATALCVALTKTGQLEAAEAACDRAISEAADIGTAIQRRSSISIGLSAADVQAVVAGNRAVLDAVSPRLTASNQ